MKSPIRKSVPISGFQRRSTVLPWIAGGTLAAGASYELAFSTRSSRQTQITGLSDDGVASISRHRTTDFGSGYRGSNEESSVTMRVAAAAVGAGLAFKLHKSQLINNPRYAEKLYSTLKKIEDYSPARVLRTLHASEYVSSYLPKSLSVSRSALFQSGHLTADGRMYQRMLGMDLRGLAHDASLEFRRTQKGSPFLQLTQAEGLTWEGTRSIRFAERGYLTGAATRFRAGTSPANKYVINHDRPLISQAWDWFKHRRDSQNPGMISSAYKGVKSGDQVFMPMYGHRSKGGWKQTANKAEFFTFHALERTQALLAKAGAGLEKGTYDRVFHTPFKGKGGIVNLLLSKRVMPAYLGLTYLGFADFMLGHRPSEIVESLPGFASSARATLTDHIPFARDITDFYEDTVPGPQYGPLALPAMGAGLGGALHYGQILTGKSKFVRASWVDKAPIFAKELDKFVNAIGDARKPDVRKAAARNKWVGGALIGAAAMLPFVPGMIGSRQTAAEVERIHSGEDLVPIRAGRWWEVGTSQWEGGKIAYYRPHRIAVIRSGAEKKALWGSEANYWFHHPLVNPVGYLMNPYGLEDEHYKDRPYPISSPAFSDVPLVGPVLAATVGRVVKPPVRMHEGEWDQNNYRVGSALLQPRGPGALPGETPREEFGFGDTVNKQTEGFFEFIGFPGFVAQVGKNTLLGSGDHNIYLQGSREMDSLSRRFYELNLGAGLPLDEGMSTEPLRRFIQREDPRLAVNDIPNEMPSWLPGPDDYAMSFRHGDPYTKVSEGYLRLPGPGYEALHPELEGVNPEDYPDVTKFSILADVAYGSTQYFQFQKIAEARAKSDTMARMEYDEVMARVKEQQRSATGATLRKFSGDVETISGTVAKASASGVQLKEYPGRVFTFSGVGTTAADMSALALGDQNYATQQALASAVDERTAQLNSYLSSTIGSRVSVTTPLGAVSGELEIPSVVGGINRQLLDRGLGTDQIKTAGPEAQAMFGGVSQQWGRFAEGVAFQGDQSFLNPMRYLPSPAHTKIWGVEEPTEEYLNHEVYGTKMRRWDRLIDDFAEPYFRGGLYRLSGKATQSGVNTEKEDLETLADHIKYLQGVHSGILAKKERSNIGTDLFGAAEYVATTLPRRERPYFQSFLAETNPQKRRRILENVSPELARTLQAQWVARSAKIAQAEGREVPNYSDEGRLVTDEGLADYQRSGTKLGYGDYLRSQEIAEFFSRKQLHLPDADSEVLADYVDPEDVKLKIIQNEGMDYHDFGIYDDRAALLGRKPYIDGAVRELVQPDGRSVEALRQAVERMMLASTSTNPDVRVTQGRGPVGHSSVHFTHYDNPTQRIRQDIRRNPDKYN